MIDTLCLDYIFTINNFETLINAINELASSMNRKKLSELFIDKISKNKKQKIYSTSAFTKYGFTKVQIIKNYNNFEYGLYHLQLVYKPAQVNYYNLYALSSLKDLTNACNKFNAFIDLLNSSMNNSFNLPYINKWKVIRIDYAFQFITPYAELYTWIFHKSNLPAKNDKYKTSLYYSNTSTTVNFYDKTNQLIEKNLLPANILKNPHIIRLEVQCKKKYLSRIKSVLAPDEDFLSIYDVWNAKIAYTILSQKLIQLFGIGNFYSYDSAEEIIKNLYKGKTENILNLLLLSGTHTLEDVFDFYDKKYHKKPGYAKNQLRRILSANNINTILLPDNSPITCLTHPIKLLNDEYKKVLPLK